MFVESSQVQRMFIFLGHPSYSLSVVLFSLLLFSGVGGYAASRIKSRLGDTQSGFLLLSSLVVVVLLFDRWTPGAIAFFSSYPVSVRILVAAGVLCPLGALMGAAFPIGMDLASARAPFLIPWLWGVNGAASVLGTVLAILVAFSEGISRAYWVGFWCYAVAFLAWWWGSRPARLVFGKSYRPTKEMSSKVKG